MTKRVKRSGRSVQVEDDLEIRRSLTLETLPPEVLETILRLLKLDDVAGSIRSVSRRWSNLAASILNGAFFAANGRVTEAIVHAETRMSRSTNHGERLNWSKALSALELIKAQYKMLKAVTWRYTHPPKSANFERLCFYAGSLLDEMYSMINEARFRPGALYSDRGVNGAVIFVETSPRLASFVALCKRFMNYFEKVSEYKLNRSALVSGCKAVDVLDCLAAGRRVTRFQVSPSRTSGQGARGSSRNRPSGSIVTMGLRYVMRRAWFTCLQVPCAPDENSWREDQRFMYLRLRRLVGSVNEHHFENFHYERQIGLRATRARVPPRTPGWDVVTPSPSTYSGYGVYAGRFFYYGNMNKYAYESKFKYPAVDTPSDDEQLVEVEEEESERRIERSRGRPTFDLVIRVELRCSSELAPLAVMSKLRSEELDELDEPHPDDRRRRDSTDQQELYVKLDITCPASAANRLPANFTWEHRAPNDPRRTRRTA